MQNKLFDLFSVLAIVVLLGGCATGSPTPELDLRLGQSVNAAKAKQTIDPEASKNTDAVSGIGGIPARESIERYHDTFKAPPPTFVIINAGPGGTQ
jgi:hypothetical protein